MTKEELQELNQKVVQQAESILQGQYGCLVVLLCDGYATISSNLDNETIQDIFRTFLEDDSPYTKLGAAKVH